MQVDEKSILNQLLATLQNLPGLTAERDDQLRVESADTRIDGVIDLSVAGQRLKILVEVKREVYPRDVPQLIWGFYGSLRNPLVNPLENALLADLQSRDRRPLPSNPRPAPGDPLANRAPSVVLVAAESISPAAKDLLQSEQIGYFDTGGSLFLPAPTLYLLIDKPTPKKMAKAFKSLFTGARSRVVHALLEMAITDRDRWVNVQLLANDAMASPATSSQVLVELESSGWMKVRGQGPAKERKLVEPAALLDAWVQHLGAEGPPRLSRYYVPNIRAEDLPARLDQMFSFEQEGNDGPEYVLTGEMAAQHYAPYLSSISQVRCYVRDVAEFRDSADDDVLRMLKDATGAQQVDEGANLIVIDERASRTKFLFSQRIDGVRLASPILVYLDLLQSAGRAKDMAEHLRREKIGF